MKKYMKSRKTRNNRRNTRNDRRKRGGGSLDWGDDCRPGGGRDNFSSCNKNKGLECLPKIFPGDSIGTVYKCAFPKTTMGFAQWLHSR